MRSRGVIGRRIVAIKQDTVTDNTGARVAAVRYVELDNGLRLVPMPHAMEDEGDPAVDLMKVRPGKGIVR